MTQQIRFSYRHGVNTDLGTNVLHVTGTYLIVIRGTEQSGPGLSFQFAVRDVSQPPVSASGFNVVRSGDINPGETNLFTFTAPAGTPAYYDALVPEGQSDTGLEIAAPNGEVIVSENSGSSGWGNATFDYGPFVLRQSGTYTIRIIGNSGGRYRFRLLNLWSNSVTLSFGTTNAAGFGETNGTVIFRVNSGAGQRFFYDALLNLQRDGRVGPWRASSFSGWDYGTSDQADFWSTALSPETLYYLLNDRTGDPANTYRFRVIALDQAPAVTAPINTTVTNLLSDPHAAHVSRVNLTAGQRLFWDFSSSNPGLGWRELSDPQGQRATLEYYLVWCP